MSTLNAIMGAVVDSTVPQAVYSQVWTLNKGPPRRRRYLLVGRSQRQTTTATEEMVNHEGVYVCGR